MRLVIAISIGFLGTYAYPEGKQPSEQLTGDQLDFALEDGQERQLLPGGKYYSFHSFTSVLPSTLLRFKFTYPNVYVGHYLTCRSTNH